MKRGIAVLCAGLLLLGVLSGCGKSASSALTDEAYNAGEAYAQSTTKAASYGGAAAETSGDSGSAAVLPDKIVYTGYAQIETTAFDETVEKVYALLDTYGAYLESSYIDGVSYADSVYGTPSYRQASFTLRIPQDGFEALEDDLGQLGSVTSLQNSTEDITSQYYDTQTRLASYQAEADRLNEMMRSAETVSDMIEIESRLSDVTYQIDSLTSEMNRMQAQVDYSTLTISLSEVEALTPQTPAQQSYWQKMAGGFKATLSGVGAFFSDLLLWIAAALPVLVVLAAVGGGIAWILLASRKKKKRAKVPPQADAPVTRPNGEEK